MIDRSPENLDLIERHILAERERRMLAAYHRTIRDRWRGRPAGGELFDWASRAAGPISRRAVHSKRQTPAR